jgi:hypothetical protein
VHDRVIALFLADSSLSASIPSKFGQLTSLNSLRLGTNRLFGSLPKEFANLPYLVEIDLSDNRLTGTLPTFTSPYIRIIDLGHNDFHGSIPAMIAESKETILQKLVLSQNRLSGTLPDSISHLSNLNFFDASNNNLHGEIPNSIGNLHLLRQLHLNNNFLVGPIPSTIATSHIDNGRIEDVLEEIHLNDNSLSGTVPVQLADLPKLKKLLIYENKLTGDIPADICSPTINDHFFQHVSNGDPNIDYCDAISCPADSVAREGVYPCTKCKNPHFNPYIGRMRSCNTFTNQRSILKQFYASTSDNGKWNGDDGDNWSDDDTFLCDLTGVTCDINFNVIAIQLKNRGLKGTIPDEIGFLQYLEVIDLSDNDLYGYLPSDFRWAPLKSMDISGNSIRGIVPPKLCLKDGVNGNGLNGDFNCDHIACPANTYNYYGRRNLVLNGHSSCLPCKSSSSDVIGSKECKSSGIASGVFGVIIIFLTLILSLAVCFIASKMAKYKKYEKTFDEGFDGVELANTKNRNYISDGTEDSVDSSNKNKIQDREPMIRKNTNNKHHRTPSATRNMAHTANLPYPEAAEPIKSVQRSHLNSNKSVLSVGSGSSNKSGKYSSGMSVASNRSGKYSVGSEDSSSVNRGEAWLDVPNIS